MPKFQQKTEKIRYRKKNLLNYQLAQPSQTEPAFIKFLQASIEILPHRLSDELLKTVSIKSIKSKVWNQLKRRSEPTHIDQFCSDICFDFSVSHHFAICTDDTKYCKHGIDLLLLCEIGAIHLIREAPWS